MIIHDEWTSLLIWFCGGVDTNGDFSAISDRNLSVGNLDILWCGRLGLDILAHVHTKGMEVTFLVGWRELAKSWNNFQGL